MDPRSLTKADSMGFIMTNGPNWRPRKAVRFNEALGFLREAAEPYHDQRAQLATEGGRTPVSSFIGKLRG